MEQRRIIATTVGIVMIAFGLSQVIKPKRWEKYIPNSLDRIAPIEKSTAMKIHGGGNIMLGLTLISNRKPAITRSIAGIWWIWVSLFCGRFDWRIAARDISIGSILLGITKKETKR